MTSVNSAVSQVPQEIIVNNDKKCASPELHEEMMKNNRKYRRETKKFERKLRREQRRKNKSQKRGNLSYWQNLQLYNQNEKL